MKTKQIVTSIIMLDDREYGPRMVIRLRIHKANWRQYATVWFSLN
jgi:hypothetical protein